MTDTAMDWIESRPGQRWYRADGAEIIKERSLRPTLEEYLETPTTYVLKLPGQLWRDVQSFATLHEAQDAATLSGDTP